MAKIFESISRSKAARVAGLALVVVAGITFISMSSAQHMGVGQNLTIISTGVPDFPPGQPCVRPQDGDRFHVHQVSGTNPSDTITYVFDGAVFHSNTAGCAVTVENPQTTGGSVTGKTLFAPGESGSLTATFDTHAFNCGRVQYDLAFNKQGDPGIAQGNYSGLFYGLILDYGHDCVTVQPCQGVSVTLGKSDEQTNVTTVTGNINVGLAGSNVSGTLMLDDVAQPVTNGQVIPFSFPRPAAGQSSYTKTFTLNGHQGSDLCDTESVSVPVPPQDVTVNPCTGVSVTLGKSGEQTTSTHVTGNVVIGVAGTDATANLTLDDAVQAVTNGQAVPFSFLRPAAGQSAYTKTYTLRGLVGAEVCDTETVSVTVPPQDVVIEPCLNVSGHLANANQETTSTTVTGNVVVTLGGSGVTGRLGLDGNFQTVTNGQSIPYSIDRPGSGSNSVTRTYTLNIHKGDELCATDTLTVTAPPREGGGGGGGSRRSRITRSKTAWNETIRQDAGFSTAQAGHVITYTLTADNRGSGSERNFEFEDDISDVLDLAELVNDGGAEFDSRNQTLTWPKITVPARSKVTKTFTIRVKSKLPINADCIMENTFGNTHRVGVACPKVSGTFTAPKTGSESFIAVALALMSVAGFAAYQLKRKPVLN